MPIYEYRCESCGHEFDALQKLSDNLLQDCPDCEARSLRRLMSAPSFRLKGEGWYETDFKSDKESKRNLVDSRTETKGDKGDKGDKADKADKADKKTKEDNKSSEGKSSKKRNSSSSSTSDSESSAGPKSKGSGFAAA